MPVALFEDLILYGSKKVIPAFIYGTAWKKERTADLVYQAICSGVRAIDTAAQPKHYQEHLVGDGIRQALSEGKVSREELYIQTKFTSIQGQDPARTPYDPTSSITQQVHTSIASSLHNLRTTKNSGSTGRAFTAGNTGTSSSVDDDDGTYIDCLLLHSPLPHPDQTLEAWRAASTYVPNRIRNLGISNTGILTLELLLNTAAEEDGTAGFAKPAAVQNRFHAETGYDAALRTLCAERGLVYQAFWTLTANSQLVNGLQVRQLSQAVGVRREEAYYCLVLALDGVVVLNGTSSKEHLVGDLETLGKVRAWAVKEPEAWGRIVAEFKGILGN